VFRSEDPIEESFPMPYHYKLSPAVIAALLSKKQNASPPDPPVPGTNPQQPEADFTPLEDILGESTRQGSFRIRSSQPPTTGSGLSNSVTSSSNAAPAPQPINDWPLSGLIGLAGFYSGGGTQRDAYGSNFKLDPATMDDMQSQARRESLATNNPPASAQTQAQYQSDAERDVPYVLSPNYRRLAQIIRIGEGNYESYNTGTKGVRGGKVGYAFLNPPDGTVTGKRIIDILATHPFPGTDKSRMFAVGAYQITPPALEDAFVSLKLSGNELMNSDTQDRIFAESLVKGDLKRYMDDDTGKPVDQTQIDRAQYAAARQWASIAVPYGYPTGNLDAKRRPIISDGKMSYYGGPANSAHMAATRALRAFLEGLRQPPQSRGSQRLSSGGR
jgi:hypothetical protein